MENKKRKRVSAVIVKKNRILLIKRIKLSLEYFVFPGGGIEDGESIEEALKREASEELNLKIKKWQLLFKLINQFSGAYNNMHSGNQEEYYFLIIDYVGNPKIGGPEKDRMSSQNQYRLEWIELSEIKKVPKIYPPEAVGKLLEILLKTNGRSKPKK